MPPTIDAYDTGILYAVWCTYCITWHTHSRMHSHSIEGHQSLHAHTEVGGHRAAHCATASCSPYLETGYTLRVVGALPHEVLERWWEMETDLADLRYEAARG